MKRLLSSALMVMMLAVGLDAQTSPDVADLNKGLKEFLTGASRNDVAAHDRFWAEELIYTGSSGRRVGKADILRDLRAAPPSKPGDATTTYTAEDIRIQLYGDTAIVAFRLVGTTEKGGKAEVAKYLNTGAFLKRNGQWRAVSWQATRLPRPEAEAKEEVAAVETALHQGILAADVKKLESLLDENFVWTHGAGEQMTRRQLLDRLGSGQLKYSKLETNQVTVSVYGDTAVARGVSSRQRRSFPSASDAGDAAPFTAFYTLTLVDKAGAWKAVAMHTSRP